MDGLQFWSDDRSFGLEISSSHVSRILEQCAHSKAREVGGILVGYYTAAQDCAVVRAISGPPPDSRSGRNGFHRGVVGLQEFVDRIWYVDRHYYLGEWHFHPDASPVLSHQDAKELKRIASSIPYRCPEPVLFIIGGNPTQGWLAGAYVFPRGEEAIELVLKAGALELIAVE